jgi:hypothetical protein
MLEKKPSPPIIQVALVEFGGNPPVMVKVPFVMTAACPRAKETKQNKTSTKTNAFINIFI